MSKQNNKATKRKLTHTHAKKLTKSLPELHPQFKKVLEDAGHEGYRIVSFTVAKGEADDTSLKASFGGCHLNPDGTITC